MKRRRKKEIYEHKKKKGKKGKMKVMRVMTAMEERMWKGGLCVYMSG